MNNCKVSLVQDLHVAKHTVVIMYVMRFYGHFGAEQPPGSKCNEVTICSVYMKMGVLETV